MGEEDWLLSPQAHSLSRNASLPQVPESLCFQVLARLRHLIFSECVSVSWLRESHSGPHVKLPYVVSSRVLGSKVSVSCPSRSLEKQEHLQILTKTFISVLVFWK